MKRLWLKSKDVSVTACTSQDSDCPIGDEEKDAAVSPDGRAKAPADGGYRMDGGRDAWLAIVGGWILVFNSWGLTDAFGVFQTYYSTVVMQHVSVTSISWIGSIQFFLTGFTAVFGGYLIDSGRLREMLILASILVVFGMMMTSLGSEYWHFLLAQGICVGMGSGILAVASPAVLASYFKRRRLLAGGIASTGGGFAGIILPLVMQIGFDRIGFGWSVRVLAFFMLALQLLALWAIRPRRLEKRFVPLRPHWLIEPVYMTFVFAFAFINAALFVPSFFISDYALSLGIDRNTAVLLLPILNAASTVFRVLPNWIADTYGAINILLPCTAASSVIVFCWRETRSLAGLLGIIVAWAVASSALISLPPLGIANLTDDPAEYGTRIGFGYTVAALGSLVGNPLAAVVRLSGPQPAPSAQIAQREYQGTWFVGGGAAAIAALLLVSTRFMVVGWKLETII